MDCKYCGDEVKRRRNKFCNRDCYIKWKSENTSISKEQRIKISESLKKTREENPDLFPSGKEHSKNIGISTKGKYKGKDIDSIVEVSSRTASKILKRMNIGCSRCGWNKASCDIHHINGRKIEKADSHDNLCLLCPNCHREVHEGNFDKDELITLTEYFPDNWKDFYYG